jgi:hypothetical protein
MEEEPLDTDMGQRPRKTIGRGDFIWTQDLTENAQKLYLWLLCDMGDTVDLPHHAKREGWDLVTALQELREFGIIDESDPSIIWLR